MPAPPWEDLGAFFDVDEFGVAVTIARADGDVDVVGIFDDPYSAHELGDYDVDANAPTLRIRETDAAGVARKDVVTIGARTFRVVTVEPDGTGIVRLVMAEDA